MKSSKISHGFSFFRYFLGFLFLIICAVAINDYWTKKTLYWHTYSIVFFAGIGVILLFMLMIEISVNVSHYNQYGKYKAPQNIRRLTNSVISGTSRDSDLKEWEEAVGVINQLINDAQRSDGTKIEAVISLQKVVDERFIMYLKKHHPDHDYLKGINVDL